MDTLKRLAAFLILCGSAMAQYAVPNTGIGLNVCIGPGTNTASGSLVSYSGSCFTLSINSTSYGYIDSADGVLKVNTTGFPANSVPIFQATTDPFRVATVVDKRPTFTGGGSATTIALKTNGVNNGSQSILNLANGTGVTVTDGGTGTVTIASTITLNATNNVIPKQSTATTLVDSAITDNGTTIASTEPITVTGTQPQAALGANGGTGGQIALKGATSGQATITAPAVAGTTTNAIVSSNSLQLPTGSTLTTPALVSAAGTSTGIGFSTTNTTTFITAAGTAAVGFNAGGIELPSDQAVGWLSTNSASVPNGFFDTNLSRSSAGVVRVGTTAANSLGTFKALAYTTDTNCANTGGTCGSASAGAVTIAAAATTVTVATTAVTANSEIFLQWDSSLGTRLSVTCNTTPTQLAVTTRTAGTSFVITTTAPTTNPACITYFIVN